jgi:hypothetical protein
MYSYRALIIKQNFPNQFLNEDHRENKYLLMCCLYILLISNQSKTINDAIDGLMINAYLELYFFPNILHDIMQRSYSALAVKHRIVNSQYD